MPFSHCATLPGHRGCVNRLAWNESGTLLASVSDDCTLILRRWAPGPQLRLAPHAQVATGHSANIFGVCFLRDCGDAQLATGGMDDEVRLHTLREAGGGWSSRLHYTHRGRVKAVCAAERSVFLSASEDGSVCLFDTREPPPSSSSRQVVACLRSAGAPHRAAKHVAVCPANEALFAVAANDAMARVYDRRMTGGYLLPHAWSHLSQAAADRHVLRFAPLHLQAEALAAGSARAPATARATHCDFDPSGTRLLVSYSGQGACVFDVRASEEAGPVAVLGGSGGSGREGAGEGAAGAASWIGGARRPAAAPAEASAPTLPTSLLLPTPTAAAAAAAAIEAHIRGKCSAAVNLTLLALEACTQRQSTARTAARAADSSPLPPSAAEALSLLGFGVVGGGGSAALVGVRMAALTRARLLALLADARLSRKWPGDAALAAGEAAQAVECFARLLDGSSSGSGVTSRLACEALLLLARALLYSEQPASAALVCRRLLAQLEHLQSNSSSSSSSSDCGSGGGSSIDWKADGPGSMERLYAKALTFLQELSKRPGAVVALQSAAAAVAGSGGGFGGSEGGGSAAAAAAAAAGGSDDGGEEEEGSEDDGVLAEGGDSEEADSHISASEGEESWGFQDLEAPAAQDADAAMPPSLPPFAPPLLPTTLQFRYSHPHAKCLLEGIERLLPHDTFTHPDSLPTTAAGQQAPASAATTTAPASRTWARPHTHFPPPLDGTSLVSRPTAVFMGHANFATDIKEACFWSPGAGFEGVGGVVGGGLQGLVGRRRALGMGALQEALLGEGGGGRGGRESESDDEEDEDEDEEDEDDEDEDEEEDDESEEAGDGSCSIAASAAAARRHALERGSYAAGLGRLGYIVAGSDCGGAFIYDAASTLPVARLSADSDICNAVRPHPTLPVLATSGIDRTVSVWRAGPGWSGGGGGEAGASRVCSRPGLLWAAAGRNVSRHQPGGGVAAAAAATRAALLRSLQQSLASGGAGAAEAFAALRGGVGGGGGEGAGPPCRVS